jgi:hypothetical protein
MFKLPRISAIDFPSIDFSRLDVSALRNIDIPTIDTDKVSVAVRDAMYLIVGAGVVAVEQAQARLAANKTRIETRIETVVDRFESVIPQQAGLVVGQARDITRVARQQVRGLIRSAA